MGDITKRQREILRYIKDFMLAHGTTPSIREIGEGVGLYSTSTVHAHFQRLVNCGYIEPIEPTLLMLPLKPWVFLDSLKFQRFTVPA